MSPWSPLGAFASSPAPGRDPSDLLWGLDESVEHSQGREALVWEQCGSPGSVRLQVLWDSGQPCQRGLLGAQPAPERSGARHFPALDLNLMHQTSLWMWKWRCEQDQEGRVRLEHHQPCAPCSYPALGMASPLIPGILTVCGRPSAAVEPNP